MALLQVAVGLPKEPVFNGDANRHVMTSVFFRDFIVDLPLNQPKQYALDYYQQYPALGLLIWPPLFHFVTGLAMFFTGTSVYVPRALVFGSLVAAVWSCQRIFSRRIGTERGWYVAGVLACSPLISEFGRHVMLEMPTLALVLLCLDQFDLWIQDQRPHRIYMAAILAALAALTRFDAIVLLPTLLLWVTFTGKVKQLANRHVIGAGVVAMSIVAPAYTLIVLELGDLHLRQAAESVSGRDQPAHFLQRLWFYPSLVPEQLGFTGSLFAVVGLLSLGRSANRTVVVPIASLLFGTWLTFTPLAELTSRHSIYWLPAICGSAAVGCFALHDFLKSSRNSRISSLAIAPVVWLLCGTVFHTSTAASYQVSGYSETAEKVLAETESGDRILIEGWWDGNLTYYLRHRDQNRSRHIVRADQHLYSFTNVPDVDFVSHVHSDVEILNRVEQLNVQCIVFEDPQPFGHIPISEQFRKLIRSMPGCFPPIARVDVESNVPAARPFRLYAYAVNHAQLRKLVQNNEQVSGPSKEQFAGSSCRTVVNR